MQFRFQFVSKRFQGSVGLVNLIMPGCKSVPVQLYVMAASERKLVKSNEAKKARTDLLTISTEVHSIEGGALFDTKGKI